MAKYFLPCRKKFVSLQTISRGRKAVTDSIREYSSVGSEHLPYKQRVIGSNPITPTDKTAEGNFRCLFFIHPTLPHPFLPRSHHSPAPTQQHSNNVRSSFVLPSFFLRSSFLKGKTKVKQRNMKRIKNDPTTNMLIILNKKHYLNTTTINSQTNK